MAERTQKQVTGRWSKSEIAHLKKLFRNNFTSDVAATLGRTRSSVQAKASNLGLRKTKKHLKSIRRA